MVDYELSFPTRYSAVCTVNLSCKFQALGEAGGSLACPFVGETSIDLDGIRPSGFRADGARLLISMKSNNNA